MRKTFLTAFILLVQIAFGIEDSVIQHLHSETYLERYRDHFSRDQYEELVSALKAPCCLRVMSYNVLSQGYDWQQKEENTWTQRKRRVAGLILHVSPDILCCQELTSLQIEDLMADLGGSYRYYAPLPSDERGHMEILGIFYKKDKMSIKEAAKIELGISHYSEQMQSYCFQYFLKALFVDKASGKELMVYNTHADYLKPNARLETVQALMNDAKESVYPTLIAGDFNTLPNMLPFPFQHISRLPALDAGYLLQTITKGFFRNAMDMALIGHVGPLSTFTWNEKGEGPFAGVMHFGLKLDHIFVTPETIKVVLHATETATVDGHFPSDHLPILADIAIP